jgi:hypothetical protein
MATEPIGFTPGPKTTKELSSESVLQPPAQFKVDSQTIIFILAIVLVLMAATFFVQSIRYSVA